MDLQNAFKIGRVSKKKYTNTSVSWTKRNSQAVNPYAVGNLLFLQRLRVLECILDTTIVSLISIMTTKQSIDILKIYSKDTRYNHGSSNNNK